MGPLTTAWARSARPWADRRSTGTPSATAVDVSHGRRPARGARGRAVAVALRSARVAHPGSVGDLDPGPLADRTSTGAPPALLGHDPAAIATRAAAVLDVALFDGPDGLRLCPVWPSTWWGRPSEAHGVRTASASCPSVSAGRCRPAILWEVEPAPGIDVGRVADAQRSRVGPGLAWQGLARARPCWPRCLVPAVGAPHGNGAPGPSAPIRSVPWSAATGRSAGTPGRVSRSPEAASGDADVFFFFFFFFFLLRRCGRAATRAHAT